MAVGISWFLWGDDHMFDGGGWWVIPVVFMGLMLFMMLGVWRRGSGTMPMGHMGMGGHPGHDSESRDRPLDILRQRYAAGELTDEQFDAMRSKLEGAT